MHTHYIKKLFNLEGTIIKKSHFLKNKIVFDIEMPIVEHICPNCGSQTSKIHDYYLRTIKDIPIQKKFVTIHYNQRRYECPTCGKSFNENNHIVSRESFLNIIHSSDTYENKAKLFNEWVCRNSNSPIKELASVAKTYHNWAAEIRHSLEFSYSNGCIEGINNKIKTLKRLSFGMPNFIHFKARIMLLD